MTNNQENNDNDTYVMADEPFAPPVSRVPWWAFLLALLLAGGVAIALLNNNKPETVTQSGITTTPTTDKDPSSNKDSTAVTDLDSSSNKDSSSTTNSDSSSNKDSSSTTNSDSSSNKDSSSTTKSDSSSNKDSIAVTDTDPSPNKDSNKLQKTLLFNYKEAEVRQSDISQLESFLSKIQGKAGTLTIEGHADAIGPHDYNDNLAEKRAKQVESKLLELGLDKKYQVKVKSLGEREPAESNQTEEGRAANRRVVLTFNNEEN